MRAASSIFATGQDAQAPSLPAQTDATFSPQSNASPTTGAAQQDIVTLAGRTAEGHQTGAGDGNNQFGETAAFFFAEKQSFRAGSGSGGSQTAQRPSVPQLPVKIVEESAVGQHAPSSNRQASVATAANASSSGAEIDSPPTQQAMSSSWAAHGSNTPLAELAQLDDSLQQMGINPQSISLFNRMAMVLYANDPAALRVLVQTLQSGAQQLNPTGADRANETNATQSQAVAVPTSPSRQPRLPAPTRGENNAEQQLDAVDGQSNADAGAEPFQIAHTEQPVTYGELNAMAGDATRTTGTTGPAQQAGPSQFSIQLEELNSAFTAIGGQQPSFAANSTEGQLLNVTF